MANENFTNQYIENTYQKVLHQSDDFYLVDGTGSYASPNVSGSYNVYGTLTVTDLYVTNTVTYFTSSAVLSTGSIVIDGDGTQNFFLIQSGSTEYLKVNPDGLLVLYGFTSVPTAVTGAIYYNKTEDAFFVGNV